MEAGANVNAADEEGLLPLDLARSGVVIEYLQGRGARKSGKQVVLTATSKKGPPRFFGGERKFYRAAWLMDLSRSMEPFSRSLRLDVLISLSRMRDYDNSVLLPLGQEDRFSFPAVGLTPVTKENREKAGAFLESLKTGGQARLEPALREAWQRIQVPKRTYGSPCIRILSNAKFTDGPQALLALRELTQRRPDGPRQNVVLHTYVYGRQSAFARMIMRQLAQEGGGQYRIVDLNDAMLPPPRTPI